MFANATKLVLATTTFALLTTNANAQVVDPNCVKMKDKVRCTCFFSNGGIVQRSPSGRWMAVMYTPGQLDGFFECLRRQGRPPEKAIP